MAFDSAFFLFIFLPLTFISYNIFKWVIKTKNYANAFLVLASLFFYAWGDPRYVLLLFVFTVLNFFFAWWIDSKRFKELKGLKLAAAVIFDVGLLVIFKYTGFFLHNIDSFFNIRVQINNPITPIGVSFFTLQAISYLVDVYKKSRVEKSFIDFALYLCFFPQLVIGPIVRYSEIIGKIRERQVTFDQIQKGIKRFIVGFAKKLIFAGSLGVIVDKIYVQSPELLTAPVLWFAAICYTLQILYDFSGYTDMALGLGQMFGFNLPENFNYPYISKTVTEFWRRWHITLSNWLRDYIYIPLGGNRVSKTRNIANILIVFAVSGFWHGANWNFILWGFSHGFFVVIERIFNKQFFGDRLNWLKHVYLLFVVTVGWVMFRIDDIHILGRYLATMFGFLRGGVLHFIVTDFLNNKRILIVILAAIGCSPLLKFCKSKVSRFLEKRNLIPYWLIDISYLLLFILALMQFASSTYRPFIYFQF